MRVHTSKEALNHSSIQHGFNMSCKHPVACIRLKKANPDMTNWERKAEVELV